ncbi:MAG TPA: hypothetical protein VJP59_03415 [Gemmatimonadota bacterium]|nr:hypothetical protein [Gemmatimonadota bacterium]
MRRLNSGDDGVLQGPDDFRPFTWRERIAHKLPKRLVVAFSVLAGRPVIYGIRLPWGFPVYPVLEKKGAVISGCVFDAKWQWPDELENQ